MLNKYLKLFLLSIMLFAAVSFTEDDKEIERRQREKALRAISKLEEYRRQHLGEGNYDAYLKFFEGTSPNDNVYDPKQSPQNQFECFLCPFSRDEQIRKKYEDYFNTLYPQIEKLKKTVESGFVFRETSLEVNNNGRLKYLQYEKIFGIIHDINLLSLYYIGKNDFVKALDLLNLNLDFSWKLNGSFTNYYAFYGSKYTVSEYNMLLWKKIPLKECELVLNHLNQSRLFDDDNTSYIGQCLGAILGNIDYKMGQEYGHFSFWTSLYERYEAFRGEYGRGRIEIAPLYTLIYMYRKNPDCIQNPKNKAWIEKIIKKEPSLRNVISVSGFIKEVRENIKNIVNKESYFRRDLGLLDAWDLKGLSPEVKLSLYYSDFEWTNEDPLFRYRQILKTEFCLLRTAFAAKVYKDKYGSYPDDSSVLEVNNLIKKIDLPFENKFKIIDLYNNPQLVPEEADSAILYEIKRCIIAHSGKMVNQYRFENAKPIYQPNSNSADLLYEFMLPNNSSKEEIESFREWLNFFKPLIKVMETKNLNNEKKDNQSSASNIITIQLNRPKHFWITYSIGADKEDDEVKKIYDPAENIENKPGSGDLFQIIDYEY